jgi:SAM-dependent methyltransferase
MSWTEYWNKETTIYVNARHKYAHYERVARDLLYHLPGPHARVVDYGCGDTLSAHRLAAACGHLLLCDSAPMVRERLAGRYASCSNISVISPEQFQDLDAATLDTVIINSVIQYLSRPELALLLSTSRQKLRPDGRLVLGDVVPRGVAPWRDALELLKFAGAHGFFLSAAAGLVKSYFSDYPRLRKEAGFLQFDQDEIVRELQLAGFTAERHDPNIGHNSARMTFLAVVREHRETSGAAAPKACKTVPTRGGSETSTKGPVNSPGVQRAQSFTAADYRLSMYVFMGVWLALTFPWLSGAVTIPYDAKALFQAQLQFLANAFHSGQSPFWNPATFVGVPQISDPQSLLFSPAVVLAYFGKRPTFWQLDTLILALLGLGGVAILKLCQDRGWHPAAGIVAAIAFTFGGAAAWRIQHIAQIQSLAFFALTLWLLARGLQRSSALYGALAGLAAGMMLAKPDQVAFLACYVLLGYWINHCLLSADRARALRNSIRPVLPCAVAAAMVSALPLLLTYLFIEASNRPQIALGEAVRGSLHPASLLTAVVSDLFGVLDPAVPYWGPYSEWWDRNELTLSQNMGQMYLGTLPILLILTVGLVRGMLWSREMRFYTLGVAVLLLYALGKYTPAFGVFFHCLPGVSYFRRPVDAVFLIGALLSVAAGYLVHLWLSAGVPFASYRKRALEAALVVAVLLAAIATARCVGRTAMALKPLASAAVWLAACALLLATPAEWLRRSRHFAMVLPTLVLAGDLALNNGPNESTALPPSSYEVLTPNCRNDTIRFLKGQLRRDDGSPWRDRIELVGLGFEWQNAALVHGFEGTLGYNPFRLGDVSDATGARDYIAGPDQKAFSPLFPSYSTMMANLLGLRFIVTGAPIEVVDRNLNPGTLRLVARTADAYVYENPHALPRALFVTDWKRVDFDALIASGKWPQFDPTKTVLLHSAPEADNAIVKLASLPAASSRVNIRRYENTKVVIEVDAPQSGFVILHDVWHRWWTADIDGVEAPILRANVLFRAVQMPAGHHTITFAFKPISGAIADIRDVLIEDLGAQFAAAIRFIDLGAASSADDHDAHSRFH